MMEEYFLLFGVGFIAIIAAIINDFKKREVANWINFSLITFGIVYRLYYSLEHGFYFLLYGLIGFAMFYVIGLLIYYTKSFGGGDVKLLYALGLFIPSDNIFEAFANPFMFFFVLMIIGLIYSLIYSLFLVVGKKMFIEELKNKFLRYRYYSLIILSLSLVFFKLLNFKEASYIYLFIVLFNVILIYSFSLDKIMLKLKGADELGEGDWVEKPIKINGKWIGKSIHGLSSEEIEIIRKNKVKIMIKEGIPYTPAFFFAYIILVFFFLNGLSLQDLMNFLLIS